MRLQKIFNCWANKNDASRKTQTPSSMYFININFIFTIKFSWFDKEKNNFSFDFIHAFSRLKTELDKPLIILLAWLLAKPKHIKKYAELYIDHGYDVMSISVTPWQVMWPTKGTQVSVRCWIFSFSATKLFQLWMNSIL